MLAEALQRKIASQTRIIASTKEKETIIQEREKNYIARIGQLDQHNSVLQGQVQSLQAKVHGLTAQFHGVSQERDSIRMSLQSYANDAACKQAMLDVSPCSLLGFKNTQKHFDF